MVFLQVLTEDNLKSLDELYQLISPNRESEEKFEDQVCSASDHILSLLEGKDRSVVGSTYRELSELITLINSCGYFEKAKEAESESPIADDPGEEHSYDIQNDFALNLDSNSKKLDLHQVDNLYMTKASSSETVAQDAGMNFDNRVEDRIKYPYSILENEKESTQPLLFDSMYSCIPENKASSMVEIIANVGVLSESHVSHAVSDKKVKSDDIIYDSNDEDESFQPLGKITSWAAEVEAASDNDWDQIDDANITVSPSTGVFSQTKDLQNLSSYNHNINNVSYDPNRFSHEIVRYPRGSIGTVSYEEFDSYGKERNLVIVPCPSQGNQMFSYADLASRNVVKGNEFQACSDIQEEDKGAKKGRASQNHSQIDKLQWQTVVKKNQRKTNLNELEFQDQYCNRKRSENILDKPSKKGFSKNPR